MALRAAWFSTMRRVLRPFMRAMVTYSSCMTSSMVERISNSGSPWRYSASVTTGSTRWCRKSSDNMRCHSLSYMAPGLAAPPEGNHPSEKANTDSRIMPTQNSGAARVASTTGMDTPSIRLPRRQARKAPATTPNR